MILTSDVSHTGLLIKSANVLFMYTIYIIPENWECLFCHSMTPWYIYYIHNILSYPFVKTYSGFINGCHFKIDHLLGTIFNHMSEQTWNSNNCYNNIFNTQSDIFIRLARFGGVKSVFKQKKYVFMKKMFSFGESHSLFHLWSLYISFRKLIYLLL